MNSGNTILERQNSKLIIRLLAAQRQLHSDAKVGYIVYGAIAIILPPVVAFLPNVHPFVQALLVALPVALGHLIVDWAESRQVEAASVQQVIDSKLFGMTFPNTDHDESLAARRSRSHIARKGTSDFENWYTSRIRDLPEGQAEYECQKVNIRWSRNVAVLTFLLDFMVAILAVGLSAFIIQKAGRDSLALVLLTPTIEWLAETACDRVKLCRAAGRIKDSMEDLGGYDEEHITRTQKHIYAYRCLRPVPDFVYVLTRGAEQEKADFSL